jgi:hypothetical protein|tara:strand:- start:456 stop:764 length:309 start_codon:yes stop_codon:yes gene_type:complete
VTGLEMKILNVDEARELAGFNTLTGSRVTEIVFEAIRTSAAKEKMSTSVELRKVKLRKYAIKECREIITEQGFKIDVSENKGLVTLNVSWLFPSDSEVELVL